MKDFSSSPQEKDLLMLASQISGVNVSELARNAALQVANEVVRLSNRDQDLFIHALNHPPAPLPALKKAMKKYKQWK